MSRRRRRDYQADSPPASFVVPVWAAIFGALGYVSLLRVLMKVIPWLSNKRRSYAVVDSWVMGHTFLALGAALLAQSGTHQVLLVVLVVYGALRVLEIIVTQVNVLLFDEWRAHRASRPYALRGYRRLLLLLLHNYAEVIFWFMAAIFTLSAGSWLTLEHVGFSVAFRAALLSMVSFSSDSIEPTSRCAGVFLAAQSLVGVFMTLLTLARFLALMPTPMSLDPTEVAQNKDDSATQPERPRARSRRR